MASSQPSTPENSKGPSSKPTSSSKSRKIINITVYFLDDSSHVFQLQAKTLGQVLFDKVCKFINLVEVDYFGLEFEDDKRTKCWLDNLKPLCNQISSLFPTMYFCVKFYTPDPVQLEDEFTRYLYALQLKKDLASGLLQCNDNTAAVIISYIVQAEIGDFNLEKFTDSSYLLSYKFVPDQGGDLEQKIMENHKKLIGQTPAEADMNLLETARRCELYGIKMTPAKDPEGHPLNLAVAHLGILVFQNFTKINTFSWSKIRKLSFKRKKFLIKLHPEGIGYYKEIVEYYFDGRNECKNFWKKCIENHTFFRCTDAKHGMRQKPKIFSRGSSFRYSGRTQKQVSEFVRESCLKRPPFQRSTSLRTPSSPSKSIGSPITPQPLLPIPGLASGSMSDLSKEASPPKKLSVSEPTTPYVAQDINRTINGDITQAKPESPAPAEPGNFKGSNIELSPIKLESNNNTLEGSLLSNSISQKNRSSTPQSPKDGFLKRGFPSENSLGLPSPIRVTAHIEPLPSKIIEPRSMESLNRLSGGSSTPKPDDQNANEEVSYQSGTEENLSLINDLQQSYGSSTFYVNSPLTTRLGNSKKTPTDRAYCLAKELLMTERTYRKDLEIINVIFREDFNKQTSVQWSSIEELLELVNPLYEKHCVLLRDLEQRLAFWESKPCSNTQNAIKGVGDIILNNKEMIKHHQAYLKKLPSILELIQRDLGSNEKLAAFYQQFENQKFCYLPLTSFMLRPAFRLPYYSSLLKSLLNFYDVENVDYNYCLDAIHCLKPYCENFEAEIIPVVNFVKLMELQRSLIGFPNLLIKNREFVREGCLFKISKNGCHQHMFFLFTDILLYATRIHSSNFRFKVQGQMPTLRVKLQKSSTLTNSSHSFTFCSGEKQIVVSASSEKEYSKWIRDLERTLTSTQNSSSHVENNCLEEKYESSDEADDVIVLRDEKQVSHHSNTTIHICWHRNISISLNDLGISLKHCISGYLLRKFKNNSGWQKLWVVLANLCLFFYKSYLDESPLASLPLAGYRVLNTVSSDIVCGECIFKLQFKNHEYFFMVESKHTYERWTEAINYCTLSEEENTKL